MTTNKKTEKKTEECNDRRMKPTYDYLEFENKVLTVILAIAIAVIATLLAE